jgi:hypothetical protein
MSLMYLIPEAAQGNHYKTMKSEANSIELVSYTQVIALSYWTWGIIGYTTVLVKFLHYNV